MVRLLERVARADGPKRLADPLAQAVRQAVYCRDDRAVVLGGLAHGDERGAVRGGDQLGGNHIAAAQRVDLPVHHRLRALALGEFAGQGQIERCSRRAPHSSEPLADGRGVEQPDHARLCEVDP